MMKLRAFCAVAGVFACAILPLASAAEVPRLLHYQGTVLDSLGEPVSGSVDVELGIWDAASGGGLLYAESHAGVALSEGVFSIPLGEGEVLTGSLDADLFSSPTRWLELMLDGEVMEPRQRIGSVGYALVAEQAEHAEVAETLSDLPADSEVVSTAGGTFTGPVSLAGPSGATNVSLGSVPGQPEHGLVAVNNAAGDESARLSIDSMGHGEVGVNDVEGRSMVEVGSSEEGEEGFEEEEGVTSGILVEGNSGSVTTRGPNGNVNVRLSSLQSDRDHGFVSANNANGDMRAGLFVDPRGNGALQLRNPAGTVRMFADGNSRVTTYGPNKKRNAGFSILTGNPQHGVVFVADAEGNGRASLHVASDGTGRMDLLDAVGKRRVLASGTGSVTTYGPEGVGRTLMGAPPPELSSSDTVVAVANQAGELRASMEVPSDGAGGQIVARGPDGGLNVRIGAAEPPAADLGLVEVYDDLRQRISLGVEDNLLSENARLQLKDSHGRLRAELGDEGWLDLYGLNGDFNARLGRALSSAEHGALEVNNADGDARAKVFVDTAGQGGVWAADAEGNVRAKMGVANGAGFIETVGAAGSTNIRLTSLESDHDQGLLTVHNGAGTAVANLFADARGTGVAQIADADGDLAIAIGVASTGQGLVITGGPEGSQNVRLSSPADSPDNGSISVLDENSRVRAIMEVVPGVGSGLVATLGPSGNDNVTLTSVVGEEDHGFVAVHDEGGTARAIMAVDPSGQGRLIADVKNFVVDHPTKPGQKIVYASLEGPEAAMYYRGVASLADGSGRIDLPEHFAVLAAPGTITAQVTPRSYESLGVAVDAIGEDHIEITELFGGTGSYDVHFLVHAVRRGFEDYQPVMGEAEAQAMCAGTSSSPPQAPVSIDNVGVAHGT